MRQKLSVVGLVLSLGLVGCAGQKGEQKGDQKPGPSPEASGPVATADIKGPAGSSLIGNATFQQKGDKLLVRVQIQGAPAGEHGVHIHEKGDCGDPEFKSAGGHFNPMQAQHGAPGDAMHHPGDFGNMTVKGDGTGTLELEVPMLTVADGPLSVQGKGIIVHEKADDLKTQPTGNAGGRIGCGEIKATASPVQQTPSM